MEIGKRKARINYRHDMDYSSRTFHKIPAFSLQRLCVSTRFLCLARRILNDPNSPYLRQIHSASLSIKFHHEAHINHRWICSYFFRVSLNCNWMQRC
jgi:hypothetical protein